jgi:hypothetical protein
MRDMHETRPSSIRAPQKSVVHLAANDLRGTNWIPDIF